MIIQGANKRERHAVKLRIGWAVADKGGSKGDFANALGVSKAAVSRFLKIYPELSAALKDGRSGPKITDQERAERFLMCAQAELGLIRWCDVARAFGISRSGIVYWSAANAADVNSTIDALCNEQRRAA